MASSSKRRRVPIGASAAEIAAELREAIEPADAILERVEALIERAHAALRTLEESDPSAADPASVYSTRQEAAAALGVTTAKLDAWYRRANPPPGRPGNYNVTAICRWLFEPGNPGGLLR